MGQIKTFENVYPDWYAYEKAIERALSEFLSYEAELCQFGFERPATIKLGGYLWRQFRHDWDVDCEYDKAGLQDKEYDIPVRIAGERCYLPDLYKKFVCQQASNLEIERKIARPDVIVHHRALPTRAHNLLMIEAKIGIGPTYFDFGKLFAFTRPVEPPASEIIKYQYGLFLRLPVVNKSAGQIDATVEALVFTENFEPQKREYKLNLENLGLHKAWRIVH